LRFFRLKPYKIAFLSGNCSITEVIEQLYFILAQFLTVRLHDGLNVRETRTFRSAERINSKGVFMNKWVAIITSVMVMAALISSCQKGPFPQYEDEDNFVVSPASDKGVRIVNYLDYTQKASIDIPPRIKNMAVTEIGPNSIGDRWFTKVTIPDTVVSIMDFSFSGNFIREVNFPGRITEIGNGAFMNNRLTSIVIPDSVKRIGYRAFFNNPLRNITIGSNVELDEIGDYDTGKEEEWKYTAFEGTGFDEAYKEYGRMAGTYNKVNDFWQFVPRPQG
jgi:hypothetical protein